MIWSFRKTYSRSHHDAVENEDEYALSPSELVCFAVSNITFS
jgi:hypothetical protein